MGYDSGDSFPFDFESNGIPFGSNLKGKLSPRSYPIQFERKWKHSFLSVWSLALIFDKVNNLTNLFPGIFLRNINFYFHIPAIIDFSFTLIKLALKKFLF